MKNLLYSFCFLFILSGCSTEPSTDGTPMGWETLDAGDFSILAPSGWEYTSGIGIDSIVGKFSDGETTLIFDYGMNAGVFENNSVYFEDPSAYSVTEETIDGLTAKMYLPVVANSEKPTVLSIANFKGTGPCTEDVCILTEENFQMLGDNLSADQVELAVQIFKTVDFK